MIKKNKKAISTVIASVLLVLITFMAIGMVWVFVKPFVQEGLEESGSCFELRDQAEISQGDYTYHNSNETSIVIKRGFENIEIRGFKVSISFDAESEVYDLINSQDSPGVKMNNGTSIIEIPVPGASKRYIINKGNGNRANLGIITKSGNVCDMGSFDIPEG